MLKIRMSRFGKKKQPTYRIIVSESSKDPWGHYLENLGHYNPETKEKVFKADRIKYWVSKGAQITPTLHNLLVDEKIIEAEKIKASKGKKKKKEKEEKPKEEGTEEKPKEEKTSETETPEKEVPTKEKAEPEQVKESEKPAEEGVKKTE